MTLAILALVLGPSCVVFLAGCLVAFTRTWRPLGRGPVRASSRGREAV
jgi:hypothetical protein